MYLFKRGGWMVQAVAAISLLMVSSACSGGPSPGRSGTDVPVKLKDFRIGLASHTLAAGRIDFDIRNPGPSTHEFLIVRTDLPSSRLPLGRDGLTVDEESPELDLVEEDSELDIGAIRVMQVDLSPGHYVLYCNLEGHYLGGMHTSLVVT
jgi:uncharacterized cupredoxin-like copper-binding protein